ncbi:MAG: YadA-like family protein [Propionivibrio sp.]
MTIVNSGGSGATVDQNGKITTGIVDQSTASLTLTNGVGNTHWLIVTEKQATISGGTHSTSLTLDDNGARFSNATNGAPVKVTGVADGTEDFDAVNFRQLKGVAAGVAGTSAMANIPQVDQNKRFAVGLGLGNFQSMTAVALGASYRAAENVAVRVSASTVGGISKSTVVGAGVGISW